MNYWYHWTALVLAALASLLLDHAAMGVDAAQHGLTTVVQLHGGLSCEGDVVSPGNAVAGVLTDFVTGTWLTTTTNYLTLPCGPDSSPGDVLYEFKPNVTGLYEFTLNADSSRIMGISVVHCNNYAMYTSGFFSNDMYQDACVQTAGASDILGTYLFEGSIYYVAVTYSSGIGAPSSIDFSLTVNLAAIVTVSPDVRVYEHNDSAASSSPGLTPLAIFGIVVGSLFALAIIVVLVMRRRSVFKRHTGVVLSKTPVVQVPTNLQAAFGGESIEAPMQVLDKTKPTVMISYQWDSQPTAFIVRDFLVSEGRFNVIIDEDGIRGNFLSWMEWAVLNCDAMIILVTREYNNSKNCEREACRAAGLKKNIVPIILEPGFTGERWLAMALSGYLYYDGSSSSSLEQNLRKIVDRELPKEVV